MSQAWRKDDTLSTADLAGRTVNREDSESLRAETPAQVDESRGVDGPRLVDNAPASERSNAGEDVARNDRASQRFDQERLNHDALNAETTSSGETGSWRQNPGSNRDGGLNTSLLSEMEMNELRGRWNGIQAEFVDEPRRSVEQADQLVATAMQRLAEGFANERSSLEKQWDSGDNVSTEDLRVALQRYRAFFGRLLNAA
jgi:hypothetical protein